MTDMAPNPDEDIKGFLEWRLRMIDNVISKEQEIIKSHGFIPGVSNLSAQSILDLERIKSETLADLYRMS
jgi:hypothetical protein